jgi:hypothetical protein
MRDTHAFFMKIPAIEPTCGLYGLLTALILTAALPVCPLGAQTQPSVISGTVRDAITLETLSGVTVTALAMEGAGVTDARGRFLLHVPAGRLTLQTGRIGYSSRTIDTTVARGDTLRVDIALSALSVLLGEVTVVAERSPLMPLPGLGGTAISPTQIEHIGGSFGDPFRALQALPGVTSNNEMSCQFNVRGGSTGENLILLGGAQMLEPFHVKESPNTSLSIVNVDLLRSITFVPGGFTARYGDRLSSVLDLEYREGNREKLSGQFEASLTDGTVTLEGPYSQAGSALVSFRSTYSDYIARYLTDGTQRAPRFYDLQGTAGFDAGENHHITAQFLTGRDMTSGLVNGDYGVSSVSLSSRHMVSPATMLRTSFSYYRQYQDLTRSPSSSLLSTSVRNSRDGITLREARLTLDGKVAPWYSINLGVEIQDRDYKLDHTLWSGTAIAQSQLPRIILDGRSYRLGGSAENLFQFTPALLVNAGIRADHLSLTGETKVSPRLLAAYHIPNGPVLRGAVGTYYQSPSPDELLAAAGAGLPPQQMLRAVHYIIGLQHQLRSDLAFRVDLYQKRLYDLISSVRLRSGEIVHSSRNDAQGYARGFEVELSLKDERVMAWINVALMVAKEENIFDGRGYHYSPYDQQKTVTAVFEYRVADRWTVNLRAFYGSGYAYGDDLPGVSDKRQHYPNYTRADARINYQFPAAGLEWLSFLEIMNLFNFRNVQSFSTVGEHVTEPDFNLLLPRVVNIGLKVRF